MDRFITILFILAAIATNTIPRWVNGIDGNLFCRYQAASFLLMSIATMGIKDKIINILWQWTILLALNNFYDEVFGDPLHCGWVEISFAITVTIWTIIRLVTCKKSHS